MDHGLVENGTMEFKRNSNNGGLDKVGNGEFLGHFIFGFPILLSGLWCMFNVSSRYCSVKKCGAPYRSTTWFTWNRFPNSPVEPWMMLAVSVFIMMSVIVYNVIEVGYVPLLQYLHNLICVFTIILSAVQLLQFYKVWVMPGLDYVCYMMFFAGGGFVMYYHLHLHPPHRVTVFLHIFLCDLCLAATGAAFLEAMFNKKPVFAMVRGMFTFFIGLHIIYTGFVISPSPDAQTWDLHSHKEVTKVIIGCGAEMASVLIANIAINGLVDRCYGVDSVYVKALRQKEDANGNGDYIYKHYASDNLVTKRNEKDFI